jgi:hypothetical protein
MACACTCDYDSVTGDFYEYVCDWCSTPTDWEIQKNTVEDLIQAIFEKTTTKECFEVLMVLMRYLMTIPAFLCENTTYHEGFSDLVRSLKLEFIGHMDSEHCVMLAKFEHFLSVICRP